MLSPRPDTDEVLLEELLSFEKDPLGFVLWAFPWGEEGTELEHETGPETWQTEILTELGATLNVSFVVRLATTSGHGIGKSALVSWIILWAISTFPDTKGVVTANTETQLKTKTWAELAKWFNLFIAKHLFDFNATAITIKGAETEEQKKFKIDMVPWSERNTEAFAGLHNLRKRLLLIMDEASAIPDMIWETAEGALTDKETQIIWAVFGNPTRNKGRFRDCFEGGKFAKRWSHRAVDSRTVSFTNKKQIQDWLEDYGEDSDFFRVRVRGAFPRVDAESFIPYELALEASRRTPLPETAPIILGVDVGRFGDDPSVIYPRQGRDAVTHPVEVLYGLDTMQTASRVAAAFLRLRATMCMVDAGGVGGGVFDRLVQLKIPALPVDFGSAADGGDPNDGTKYSNKRAQIYGKMRNWLKFGAIPEKIFGAEMSMVEELTAPNYGFNANEEIQLERKKDMRKRGIKSNNCSDALACTFAYDVFEEPVHTLPIPSPQPTGGDYNPFSDASIYGGMQ